MRGANRIHRNPYSLMSSPGQLDAYEISVRRMEQSRGGSHFMHDQVQVGSALEIAHPVNLFPLDKIARKHLLIAGGIGITPFMAQLVDLRTAGVPYELHYASRAPEHCAFGSILSEREPGRVHKYYDSTGELIDFEGLLSNQPLGTHVYVCGPGPMIEKVVETARERGWPDSHIHWEQFSAPPWAMPSMFFLQGPTSTCTWYPIRVFSNRLRLRVSRSPTCAAEAYAVSAGR